MGTQKNHLNEVVLSSFKLVDEKKNHNLTLKSQKVHLSMVIMFIKKLKDTFYDSNCRERSDSVVECLTRDREATGSSLTGVTALRSLSKTYLS